MVGWDRWWVGIDFEIDVVLQRALQHCRSTDFLQRMHALQTLEKEYVGQVEPDILLPMLRTSSHYQEQSLILSLLRQLGERTPVDELVAYLLDRTEANKIPCFRMAETQVVVQMGCWSRSGDHCFRCGSCVVWSGPS